MPGSDSPRVRYAAAPGQLYIAFHDGAVHKASVTAEKLVEGFLSGAPQTPAVILDLSSAGWLDSTFAGWMIRVSRRVAPLGGSVVVSRCPEGCRSSLDVMGLTDMFSFVDVEAPPGLTEQVCPEFAADAGTIALMAEAHELLADVSPENERVFRRIAEALRRELEDKSD
jgi:anti-anti-sigma regulatory factor